MLGVRETYRKVMTANGPAQMLTYAFWGALMAGMFHGFCDKCLTSTVLMCWAAVSVLVVPVTIWGSREMLRNALLLDVVISAYILVIVLTHQPHATEFVYYSMTFEGMTASKSGGHQISEWFHIGALIWMTLHGIYLADLTQRQINERQRFAK
jgi:hypothetical protein